MVYFRNHLVGGLSRLCGRIERVEIFHEKLSGADETEARASLVSELVCDLVEQERQLFVGQDR